MVAKKGKKEARKLRNLPARSVGVNQARRVKGGMRKAGGDPSSPQKGKKLY